MHCIGLIKYQNSMKIYVKLRDAGTIFNDSSASITVTGKLPVEIAKKSPKVAKAIRNGVLLEVEAKVAEAELAQAAKDGKALSKLKKSDAAKVVVMETELAKAKEDNDELTEKLLESEEARKELEEAAASDEATKKLKADLAASQKLVKELTAEVSKLKK